MAGSKGAQVHSREPQNRHSDIDGHGRIIDHQTTKRSFPVVAANKEIQLTAYSLAYRKPSGKPEGGLRLDVMVRNKEAKTQQFQTSRTRADVDRFLCPAEQAKRGIKAGVF